MILPILRKELVGSGRHGRYFLVRGGYLLLLACVTVPALVNQASRLIENPGFAVTRMGREFTIIFGMLQFSLIVLLAPAFSIGTLASEKASGGLDLLHCAGVGAGPVVAGKYAARMAWIALFMVSGLPLFMAGTLMGGVGLETVALLFVHGLVAGALGTSFGFTLSGGMRQTVPALVLSYLAVAAIYVGGPMALVIYDEAIPGTFLNDDVLAWVNPIAAVLLFSEGKIDRVMAWATVLPHLVAAIIVALPALRFAAPEESADPDPSAGALAVCATLTGAAVLAGGTLIAGPSIGSVLVFAVNSALAAALAAMIAFAMRGIARRVWTRLLIAGAIVVFAWLGPGALMAKSGANFPVGVAEASIFSPVVAAALVREGWSPAVALPTLGVAVAWILAGVLLFVRRGRRLSRERAAVIPAGGRNDPERAAIAPARPRRPIIHGNPIAWRDGRGARRSLAARILRWTYVGLAVLVFGTALLAAVFTSFRNRDFGQIAIFLLVTGGGLVALIVGSGAITEERERRAMPLLALSRLSAADILLGKLWGLVVFLGPVAVFPPLVALVFFAKESPATFLTTILMTGTVLFSGAAFGVLLSSFMKRSASAAGAAIGITFLWCIVPAILVEFLNLHSFGDLLTVFNPLATLLELIDDFGKQNLLGGDFVLALIGLAFLFVIGVTSSVLAWTALQTQEEG